MQKVNCLEKEGQLKRRLLNLLSTEPDRGTFFSDSNSVREVISDVCRENNLRFRENQSYENNLNFKNRVEIVLSSLKGSVSGRESPLYKDLL